MEKDIINQEDKLRAEIKELFVRQEYAEDSLARYKTIIDTAPVGIFVYDAYRNKFKECNKKTLQMFGMDEPEFLASNMLSISAFEQNEGDSCELNNQYIAEVKRNKELTIEWVCKNKSNQEFPSEIHLAKLPSKNSFYIQGYLLDITERKNMEHKLISVNNELIRANLAKINFLSTMSHELRTPLNSIIGFAQVLADQECGSLNLEQQEYSQEIISNGQQLLTIINDILDIAKIDSGTIDVQLINVDIKSLLAGCIKKIQGYPAAKDKQFNLNITTNIVDCLLDKNRIEQVILNLLSNAIKFTKQNGKIDINANIDNDMLVISVQDNGIGIDKEKIDNVFTAFEQVDSSLSRKFSGTGLGLAIVKRIISLHRGTIKVESKVEHGTCFTISLPYIDTNNNSNNNLLTTTG